MFRLADGKLNEDVVVPPRSQEELLKLMRGIGERHRLHTPIFGHAGDGNFHVHVMFHRDDPDECRRAEAAVGELMQGVVSMGGAISGEHGIGLAKSPFLGVQHGQAEIAAMKAVKNALDPNGIMNPGKVFEPFRVWEHPVAKVTLPWD
jgi:glycolate oxidase